MPKETVVVYLTSRHAIFVPPYPKEKILPFVSFSPPGYQFTNKFRFGWNGKISLLKRDRMGSGLFRAVYRDIEKETGIKFEILYRRDEIRFLKKGIVSDRPYQNECVAKMQDAARRGGGLVLGATGTGKTRIAGMFFSRLVGAACFVVDELSLLEQAREELEQTLGEPVGQIGNQVFDPQRITVATIQTLHLHCEDKEYRPWVRSLKALLIDEVHVMMNRRNFDTVAEIEPPAVYGLTATLRMTQKPVRLKAYNLAGPVLFTYTLEQGQAEGYLVPCIPTQVYYSNYEACRRRPPDILYGDAIVANEERNGVVVNLVRQARDLGYFTVVIVERIEHLRRLSNLLGNVPHRVVCGQKEVEDRLVAKQKFEEGKVRVILANKVFKKGINIKRLDVVINAAARKDKNDAIQILGRGLRQCEGKDGLLYFDIADHDGGLKDARGKYLNKFESGTRSRARAFRERGLQVLKVSSAQSAEKIFALAKYRLEVETAKIQAKIQSEPKN